MNDVNPSQTAPEGGVLLPVAWLVVGLPLLWGVWETVKKSLALFH